MLYWCNIHLYYTIWGYTYVKRIHLYFFIFISNFSPLLTDPECKMSSPATGLHERAWTPRYTPTKTPQQQQPSGQTHSHPPPDYQHNVYIPGTPSALCTLRPSNRSELDVHNTFSTFGKKRKFISPSSYDPRDETGTEVINNDLYNE